MTTLALVLLLAAPPGLLPRKPAPPPGATRGPVVTPDPVPDRPLVPPVIIDGDEGDAPPGRESGPDEEPSPQWQDEEIAPPAPATADPVPGASRREPGPERGASDARAVPTGQWVFTRQYGWLWMAHDDAYWYAPPSGRGRPQAYVYLPRLGWDWIDAPWVWGLGPRPRFGPAGPWRFGWYRAGSWRTPWRWQYGPGPHRR